MKTDSEQESLIWEKIGEQKPALSNLVHLVTECNDPQFDGLLKELNELVVIFEDVKLNYEKGSVSTDEASKTTTLGSTLKVEINEEVYKKIQEKTTAIRNGITE